MNTPRRWLLLAVCAAGLVGCRGPEQSAVAPPAAEPGLSIGLIPEQNVFRQVERYQPLAEYLSRQVGSKIELKILPGYGNIIDQFESAKLDGAFFGSFTYALAHRKLDVEVVARPLWLDNSSTYYGLILVRTDSGIRGVGDMKGKRFVFVDKATTAGYLLPLDYFRRNGVRDYERYFGETYFAGTHEDAILDVLNGNADIGAAKNTVLERLAAADARIAKELLVLERSPRVPENALALRGDIDPGVRLRLTDALLSMHLASDGREVLRQFGALMFVPTADEEYETVYRYAEEIGLDLSTYDYGNPQ